MKFRRLIYDLDPLTREQVTIMVETIPKKADNPAIVVIQALPGFHQSPECFNDAFEETITRAKRGGWLKEAYDYIALNPSAARKMAEALAEAVRATDEPPTQILGVLYNVEQ